MHIIGWMALVVILGLATWSVAGITFAIHFEPAANSKSWKSIEVVIGVLTVLGVGYLWAVVLSMAPFSIN